MRRHKHPLAEVFGFAVTDHSETATRYRKHRLCPFNNKVANCTKDKAKDPLGVCSIYDQDEIVITCPIRFREDWLIAVDAASFFFPAPASWSSLVEVRLNDARGKAAGNVDVVLVAYDDEGKVYDFGALEIQAVYISGNIREPFKRYMESPRDNAFMDWLNQPNYPRPDYLSSSRKRLAPQLIYKGGILQSWGKKIAVALNKGFFGTLPNLEPVDEKEANVAWFIYDVENVSGRYKLTRIDVVYTRFDRALSAITQAHPGSLEDFLKVLQSKPDEKMESPPRNEVIERPF